MVGTGPAVQQLQALAVPAVMARQLGVETGSAAMQIVRRYLDAMDHQRGRDEARDDRRPPAERDVRHPWRKTTESWCHRNPLAPLDGHP